MSALRLCADLNIWVGSFLAQANGLQGSASQVIVEAISDGWSRAGPVQGIVSHIMLTRLHDVLVRRGASPEQATRYVALVEAFVRLGPDGHDPALVLGGGEHPTRDTGPDPDDGAVLDTALAQSADVLVTWNFRDFVDRHDHVVRPGTLHIRETARQRLVLIRPPEMAAWLRTGVDPRKV